MNHHPTSQASEIPIIFQDGPIQWRVFVNANGINGRPKLVRNLKKAGAVICSDPKQANVILVDATSDSGREFIREWGNDTDKVVLKHTWANACIAASKALGKDDDWGGFLAVDDGLPIAKEGLDAAEDPVKSLPTPRITPLEAPPPPSVQPVLTQAPETPHEASAVPQNVVPDTSRLLTEQYTMQYMLQQQAWMQMQMQMQMLQQQHAPYNGNHPTYPPDSSNSMPSFLSPMSQLSQGMGSYNPNSFPVNSNQNAPFPLKSSAAESKQLPVPAIPPSLRPKTPLPSSTLSSYPSRHPMTSTSPATTPIPSSSSSQSASTPSHLTTLFKDKDGRQMTFFVQIGLYKRSDTVNAIKKNGGKIIPSHCTADYAVFYSREKPNDQLYEAAVAAGRPTVIPSFVHDCIAQNTILDTAPYRFPASNEKTPTRGRKRKRVEPEDQDDVSLTQQEKGQEEMRSEVAMSQVGLAKTASPATKTVPQASHPIRSPTAQADGRSRRPSPRPPPEYTKQQRIGGNGYNYSDPERQYAEEYLKYLLEADHLLSINGIARALYQKMNHHSLGSWRTFLGQEPFRTTLEGARKTAGIAFRKRKADEERLVKKTELVEKEIGIVAHFFATGGGRENPDEEDNDEEVWERLKQQHQQPQTSSSWVDLYNEHFDKIEERYKEIVKGLTTTEST